MNQQLKTDWLAELASGRWACGTGWLQTRPYEAVSDSAATYSPLGVLCEMYRQTGRLLYRQNTHSPYAPGLYVTAYDGEVLALPRVVAEWAEMDPLPWMLLSEPSGIFNLAYIGKLGKGSFELAITAIQNHL